MSSREKDHLPFPKVQGSYPVIVEWGRRLGSYNYYIKAERERARECGAPQDAVYEEVAAGGRPTGKWRLLRDFHADHPFRLAIEDRYPNLVPRENEQRGAADGSRRAEDDRR